jgi:hypothetical protein
MKEKVENHSQCPDIEQLNAFYDGVLPEDSPVAEHVRSCDKCQKTLEVYGKVGEALKEHCRISEKQITESIKKGFYRKLEQAQSRQTIMMPKFIFQMAAALAICSGVIYFALQGTMSTPENVITSPAAASTEEIDPGRYPYYTGSDSGVLSGSINENSIPLRNFIPAGFGDTEPVFNVSTSRARKGTPKPVAIAKRVRHVWVVKNIGQAHNALLGMLKKYAVGSNISLQDVKGKLHLKGTLTKLQLVKLVKLCKKAGFELLSPQAPQPEQNLFQGSGSATTQYNAVFMINKTSGK